MLQRRRRKDNISPKSHPSLTFINNLLHSKSTYFYKWWGEKKSSKLTYSYLVPSVCILALLVGLYGFVNPNISNDDSNGSLVNNKAYAVDATGLDGGSSPSLTLTLKDPATQTTNAVVGEITYRTNQFTITSQRYKEYGIYVSGMSGKITDLVGKNISSNTVTGVGTNVAADANFPDNKWGYALTNNTSINLSSLKYSTVPNYSDAIPKSYTHTTSSPSTVTSQDFLISFAAKFGVGMPSDNYQSDVMLSVVGNPITVVEYSITGGTGAPVVQKITDESGASSTTVTLSSTKPTKTGYNFLGWSTASNATTAQYQAGGSLVLQESNPNITLYAVWTLLTWDNITTMQQMTPAICASTSNHATKQLKDARDNKTYWITKFKDGNCWMTQNLDYDDPNSTRFDSSTTSSSWGTSHERQYYDPGDKIVSGSNLANAPTDVDRHLLVGNYYSWMAATDGTGKDLPLYTPASGSICPQNWRLPTGQYDGEYAKLVQAEDMSANSTSESKLKAAPYHFFLGGSYSGTMYNVGNRGYYRTSSPYGSGYAWTFVLPFLNGNLANANGPYSGGTPMHCIVKGV